MQHKYVVAAMSEYQDKIPPDRTVIIEALLEAAPDSVFEILPRVRLKNPIITMLLSIFLGAFGLDRFYIGDARIGWFKFCTGIILFLVNVLVGLLVPSFLIVLRFLNVAYGIFLLTEIYSTYQNTKKLNLETLRSFLMTD